MGRRFGYVGGELEVFQHAQKWKAYFGGQIRRFVRGRVLEVGAGLGGTTTVLFPGDSREWVCLEPDGGLADQLRLNLQAAYGRSSYRPTVILGTLEDLRCRPAFDTILYIDVLEHIERDAAELKAASERLTSGGYIVAVCPAHQWLFTPFDERIGHFRRYDASTLMEITPANAELLCLRFLDSVGILASLANRLVLRSSEPTIRQIKIWDRLMIPPSRVLDRLLGYRVGKSVIAVWERRQ